MIKGLIQISLLGVRLSVMYNDTNSQSKTDVNCDIRLNVTIYYMNKLDSGRTADNTILKYHQL